MEKKQIKLSLLGFFIDVFNDKSWLEVLAFLQKQRILLSIKKQRFFSIQSFDDITFAFYKIYAWSTHVFNFIIIFWEPKVGHAELSPLFQGTNLNIFEIEFFKFVEVNFL